MNAIPSRSYTSSSVVNASLAPLSSSLIPYSLTCRPCRTASVRSASLCLPEPVKCCSRLPNASSGTIRRSTGRPECVTTFAPAAPDVDTVSIASSSQKAVESAFGSLEAATMSRSLTVSARRRALPASSTRRAAGCSRSAATSSSPTVSAFESSMRGLGRPSAPAASAATTFSCAFAPKPGTSSRLPSSLARLRSSSELTPRWS